MLCRGADLQRPETRRLLEGVSGKYETQRGRRRLRSSLTDHPSFINSDPAFWGFQQERVKHVSKKPFQNGTPNSVVYRGSLQTPAIAQLQ